MKFWNMKCQDQGPGQGNRRNSCVMGYYSKRSLMDLRKKKKKSRGIIVMWEIIQSLCEFLHLSWAWTRITVLLGCGGRYVIHKIPKDFPAKTLCSKLLWECKGPTYRAGAVEIKVVLPFQPWAGSHITNTELKYCCATSTNWYKLAFFLSLEHAMFFLASHLFSFLAILWA